MLTDYRTALGPALISVDKIWIPASVEGRIDFPKATAPDIRLNILTTVLGSLTDIETPDLLSATCASAFQNVLKWEPWMQMGDQRDEMMSRASGRKLLDIYKFPADYLQMARDVRHAAATIPTT